MWSRSTETEALNHTGSTFIVSAPGKVILFGEHAVLYGYPAIAVSIDLRCYFSTTIAKCESRVPSIEIRFCNLSNIPVVINNPVQHIPSPQLTSKQLVYKAWKMVSTVSGESKLSAAATSPMASSACIFHYLLSRILQRTTKCPGPLLLSNHTARIDVNSDIPVQAGLGSSAAFCVCATVTLLSLCGLLPFGSTRMLTYNEQELVKSLAHEAESIVHGTPSGIDTAICVQGGGICFTRSGDSTTITKLFAPPGFMLHLLIVNSKVSRSTAAIARSVAETRAFEADRVDQIMRDIGDVVQTALDVFSGSQPTSMLGPLVSKNHQLLVNLGVSCPQLDNIVSELSSLGLAAKITGAGCGGCVFAITNESDRNSTDLFQQAVRRLQARGFWATTVAAFSRAVLIQTDGGEDIRQSISNL
ncbi:mevalonate kinase [Opisthorchis viverrini]|uniref:Mevalonate kinase n=1 Tax=Opisthorchis viverrini TaxID=6198 RepID=A0A1S8WSG5_OPIVI|nr:mevalonate kinase [Opisthorchis viverrini]